MRIFTLIFCCIMMSAIFGDLLVTSSCKKQHPACAEDVAIGNINLLNDPNNCGKCGNACGNGTTEKNGGPGTVAICSNGVCKTSSVCVVHKEICDGIDNDCNGAIDDGFDLMSDKNNCGKCGNVCPTSKGCFLAQCLEYDAITQLLYSDEDNCGSIGHSCHPDEKCINAHCVKQK